jgi:hypothetical protein
MRYTVYRILVCLRTKIRMISSLRNFSVRILDADRFTIVVFQILDIKSNYLPGIVHKRSKLDHTDMHPLLCPVYVRDRHMQEGTSPPKCTKHTTQKVYVGHLHHYSKSVQVVWDPKKNWSHHNFMSCLTITSTPSKHLIQTSNKPILWIAYLKRTYTHMVIHLVTNTHMYSLTGEHLRNGIQYI